MKSISTETRKEAIIVLGMHRSGTSAMARALSLSGAGLPLNFLGINESNPNGHWEPQEVIDFNEKILNDLDISWNYIFGPRRRKDGKLPLDKYIERAREIIRDNWPSQNFVVFKEPRTSLLIDLWRDALVLEGFRPSFVIMVRNPLEVADSLKARNGFNRNKSIILWSTYMLSAERFTREDRRIFVSFSDLIENPDSVLDRIEQELNVMLPRRTWASDSEIDSFLKVQDRHHVRSSTAGLKGFKAVQGFYQFLQDATQGAIWNEDVSKDLSDWLASLEQTVGPIITQADRDVLNANVEISKLREHATALETARADLLAKEASLLAELKSTDERLQSAEAILQAKDALEARLADLANELTASADAKASLEADLAQTKLDAQVALNAKEELESRLAELADEISTAAEATASLEADMAQTKLDAQAALEAKEDLEARLKELRDELSTAAEARASLEDDLARTKLDAQAASEAKEALETRLAQLAKQVEALESQNMGLETKITDLRETYQSELRALDARLETATIEARALRSSEEEARIALAAARAGFDAREAELSTKVSESLKEVERIRGESTERETHLVAREETLRAELGRLGADRDAARQQAAELETALTASKSALVELETLRQRDIAEREMLRDQSEQLAMALADAISNGQRVDRLSLAALQWAVVKRLLGWTTS